MTKVDYLSNIYIYLKSKLKKFYRVTTEIYQTKEQLTDWEQKVQETQIKIKEAKKEWEKGRKTLITQVNEELSEPETQANNESL